MRQVSGLIYVPAKPGEVPEYDELVVFRPAQVLPRYVYYYRLPTAADRIPPNMLCTLWLEASPSPSLTRMLATLRQRHPLLTLVSVGSVDELAVWLSGHADVCARSVRIVCGSDVSAEATMQVLSVLRDKKVTKYTVLLTQVQPASGLVNGKSIVAATDRMRAAEFALYAWPA